MLMVASLIRGMTCYMELPALNLDDQLMRWSYEAT